MLRGKRNNWGIQRRWRGDYLNDTSENPFVEAYRGALRKEGINQKSVTFSAAVKKFNRHGKVIIFELKWSRKNSGKIDEKVSNRSRKVIKKSSKSRQKVVEK